MKAGRCAKGLLVAAGLAMLFGCRSAMPVGPADDVADVVPARPTDADRGFLLKTGAIQLGPGTGKNLWGWQGDGHSGF